jgi:hypothetical protein
MSSPISRGWMTIPVRPFPWLRFRSLFGDFGLLNLGGPNDCCQHEAGEKPANDFVEGCTDGEVGGKAVPVPV